MTRPRCRPSLNGSGCSDCLRRWAVHEHVRPSESRATLSWDALTLFFGYSRPGSEIGPDGVTPSNDIYFTTREKVVGGG
jgi:hypothetical protein